MQNSQPHETLLAEAKAQVRSVRALLSRPRPCHPEACIMLFQQAQRCLERMRYGIARGGKFSPDLRRQLPVLASEIRHAGILTERAADYNRCRLELLRSMSSEYTAAGGRAPLAIRGSISCVG